MGGALSADKANRARRVAGGNIPSSSVRCRVQFAKACELDPKAAASGRAGRAANPLLLPSSSRLVAQLAQRPSSAGKSFHSALVLLFLFGRSLADARLCRSGAPDRRLSHFCARFHTSDRAAVAERVLLYAD